MHRDEKDKLVQKYIEITKNDTIMNNWASRARSGLRLHDIFCRNQQWGYGGVSIQFCI